MRILNSVLVLLVLSAFPLSAQRFRGGVLAGITASQVDGDGYSGYNKLGLQGGVFVNTAFKYNFGAQMEIRYAGRGAQKVTTTDDPKVYKLALHYIDLPLMATYTLKKKIIFDLGLIPGYLFAKNGEDNGGPVNADYFVKFKKFDIAWLAGINYKITDNLIVNIRYSYSLRSINDFKDTASYYTWFGNFVGYHTGDYNNYLTFGVYYQIY